MFRLRSRPGGRRYSLIGLLALLVTVAPLSADIALLAPPSFAQPWQQVKLLPKTVEAAGVSTSYAELGDGSPLLMLNGTASPMSEWDPALLGALATNHRVIVVDYPGLGGSAAFPGEWTFDKAADWTAALLDVVAPGEPVNVFGWSMGGFIAQRLATLHPNKVDHLILAATNPGGEQAVLGPPWVQAADSSGTLRDYLRSNYPADKRALGRAFIARLDAATASGAYPASEIPANTLQAMVAAEDPWLRTSENWDALPQVAAPTLVVTGVDDRITPVVNSQRIAQRIPGARLVVVPGAGHSFLFQRPKATGDLITGFLGRATG